MLSGFGTLLDKLQGILSKAFLLGGFIPFILLCLINLGLMQWILPDQFDHLYSYIKKPEKDSMYFWLSIVLFCFCGGLIFWSINPILRQILEGRFLPWFIEKKMVRIQERHLDFLVSRQDYLENEAFEYRKIAEGLRNKIKDSREIGIRTTGLKVSEELRIAMKELWRLKARWANIPASKIGDALDKLLEDLRKNSADKCKELEKTRNKFMIFFTAQHQRLENKLSQTISEKEQLFPADASKIGPTQLANYSEVHRHYGISRYGIDIEFFWNRLLKFIRSDADFNPILDESKIQLDFTVSLSIITLLSVLIWSPLTLIFSDSAIPFALIFGLGMPLFVMFYRITAQNYRGYADAVRSSLDLYRFKLLEALHIEPPADSTEEKKIWQEIEEGSENKNIVYNHKRKTNAKQEEDDVKETFWEKIKNWFAK